MRRKFDIRLCPAVKVRSKSQFNPENQAPKASRRPGRARKRPKVCALIRRRLPAPNTLKKCNQSTWGFVKTPTWSYSHSKLKRILLAILHNPRVDIDQCPTPRTATEQSRNTEAAEAASRWMRATHYRAIERNMTARVSLTPVTAANALRARPETSLAGEHSQASSE